MCEIVKVGEAAGNCSDSTVLLKLPSRSSAVNWALNMTHFPNMGCRSLLDMGEELIQALILCAIISFPAVFPSSAHAITSPISMGGRRNEMGLVSIPCSFRYPRQ